MDLYIGFSFVSSNVDEVDGYFSKDIVVHFISFEKKKTKVLTFLS